MLLAITPNPALDRTIVLRGLRPGSVHRAERTLVMAGGKGINVARAAATLNEPLRIAGLLGGLTGQLVARHASAEGFDARWCWYDGETRVCILVVDSDGPDATVFNEVGDPIDDEIWAAFVESCLGAAEGTSLVTISGSLPPGIAPTALIDLVQGLCTHGHRVIVDTSHALSSLVHESPPYGIKVNMAELSGALSRRINDIPSAAAALMELRAMGVTLAIVTMGAEGALAASDDGICHVLPPHRQIVSSVGCGDSFLAGLAVGLLRNEHVADAVRLGVACATADALTIGGGLIDLHDVGVIGETSDIIWLP